MTELIPHLSGPWWIQAIVYACFARASVLALAVKLTGHRSGNVQRIDGGEGLKIVGDTLAAHGRTLDRIEDRAVQNDRNIIGLASRVDRMEGRLDERLGRMEVTGQDTNAETHNIKHTTGNVSAKLDAIPGAVEKRVVPPLAEALAQVPPPETAHE